MAVIRQNIIFGGVDSADYGIYISGEGVFDAPKRDVEMISIPGRNGSFILDKGRFENITVTYPAVTFEKDLATFISNLDAFRNAVCSQNGYQRLTDSFHPDEFRLATYINGLEIKPIKYNTAAEFDIVFECKPQRFLMGGEADVTVTTGDVIFNPTQFDAQPLLKAEGYGDINIGGKWVTIADALIGSVRVAGGGSSITQVRLDTTALNTGDIITLSSLTGIFQYSLKSGYSITDKSVSSTSNATAVIATNKRTVKMTPQTFVFGTASAITASATFSITYTYNGSSSTISVTNSIKATYDGASTIRFTVTSNQPGTPFSAHGAAINCPVIYADSTKSALGHPTYIDLEIGVAWNADGGTPVSLNNAVSIPAIMPVLAPGNNTVTFENTITSLKIVPRWWIV